MTTSVALGGAAGGITLGLMSSSEPATTKPSSGEQTSETRRFFEPSVPGVVDQTYARWLKMSRGELLALAPEPGTIPQTGAAYLPEPFVVDALELAEGITDSIIETFVVEADGACTATGSNEVLNAQWMPMVSAMAKAVTAELSNYEVAISWPAYLTASLTPIDRVTTTPHFDNDQYLPDAGVDVVAIAANHNGSRMALAPITSNQPKPGLPIELDPQDTERFNQATMPTQQAAPHRIVIFPQFGQLHGGPILDPDGTRQPDSERVDSSGTSPEPTDPTRVRNLLVFRATTIPT